MATKKNGDTDKGATAVADSTQTWGEKRQAMRRTVRDPLTGEDRDESKEEKFTRLAEHRVNSALKRLRLIKSLGNRAQYQYDEQDANKIIAALTDAVGEIRMSLAGGRAQVKGFKL